MVELKWNLQFHFNSGQFHFAIPIPIPIPWLAIPIPIPIPELELELKSIPIPIPELTPALVRGDSFLCVKFCLGSAGEPTICSHCYDVLNEVLGNCQANLSDSWLEISRVKLPSDGCCFTLLMMSQFWFR